MNRQLVLGESEPVSGTQSIDRALSLLSLVGRAGAAGASLAEVVAGSGLNKPTARRLLVALIKARLLEQDPATRRYRLGSEAYVLGVLATPRHGLLAHAAESLRVLSAETRDASFVSVRHGNYSVCLHRQEGSHPLRTHALQTGDQHPLGVGAGSLAILAALPDAEAGRIVQDLAPDLGRYGGYSPEILAADIQRARENGYALNPGRFIAGSWGIAMPVRFPDGGVAGALSIAAVESRLQRERQLELAGALRRETAAVERRMARIFGPTGPAKEEHDNG
ncbi:IclR family transcriptional regulator [Amaricoccus sp.]|uniref:IclR family transcriptional regulator n=1 Tax=Amaricoccus sp. TaxID=1872485 RepID=UPI001B473992|nr:IclR family transcriptional regulator [Amaricoccus sp.]MBP7002644.1 IclR family transcriptional regulator [Amaricoccus sp.]